MTKSGKYILCTAWCFAAFVTLQGQTEPDQGKYPVNYDTTYMGDYRHRLNFALMSEIKANGIGIITPDNKVLLYLTNLPIPNYGFMMSYRWINFQITFPINGLSTVRSGRGETNSLAMALGLVGRRFYLRNFFEYFKGYYISNPEIIFPNIPANTKIILPNTETYTYYATGYYGFNHTRFSYRSLIYQSEIQKKSAGTFLTGITLGYKLMTSPQDLLPGPIVQDVYRARYVLSGINVGYAYTVVLGNNFNASLALIPGLNYAWGAYTIDRKEERIYRDGLGINAEARLQILYEGEKFYAGVSYTGYLLTDYVKTDFPIGSAHNYLKLNVGYRFKMKPIKFLKPFGLSN